MRPVSPAEGNISILKRDQAMVGNSHSMGIAAEISKNIFRAAKWRFAVNHPVVAEELADEGLKSLRVRKILQFAVKADFAFGESVLEGVLNLPSKNRSKHPLWKKELRVCGHPVLMIAILSSLYPPSC